MYYVLTRDRKQAEEAGYEIYAHIPFLLAEDGSYPVEANWYLRARALCEWHLRLGSDALPSGSRRKFLTAPSCYAMAQRVASFLRWCERTGHDWHAVDYRKDLIGWQNGLLSGTASESGKRLGKATVNNLIGEACYFLTWAAEVPHVRAALQVPTSTAKIKLSQGDNAKSHRQHKNVEKRVGALVPRPSQLNIPSPKDVGRWMKAMRVRFPIKSLMAETMVETGIRISECNQMRIDTIPHRDKWKPRSGMLPIWIEWGNKGEKVSPDSQESSRPREILMPLDLADRIDRYREGWRLKQILNWVKAGATKEERDRRARAQKPQRLWLSEASNQPFRNVQLYRAWTQAPHCPDGWHPHEGRAYFAVESAVAMVRNSLDAHASKTVPDLTWLQGAMQDPIRMLLTPLLGHMDDATTMLYLKAVHSRLEEEFGHPSLRWQQFCDDGEE
jgi:integrase